MNTFTNKLEKFSKKLESFKGDVVLFAAIKRTDLDEKWDLVFSSSEIKIENDTEMLKDFIKVLREAIDVDINFVANILLLPAEHNIVLDIARAISESEVEENYSGPLMISNKILLKEISLFVVNISSVVTDEQIKVDSKSDVVSSVFE